MHGQDVTLTLRWDLNTAAGSLSNQLIARIRQSIADGELLPGDRLPATRQLAQELGVARGTVTTAIELLVAEGVLVSRMGSGSFVSDDALSCSGNSNAVANLLTAMPRTLPEPDVDVVQSARIDFRPCGPSLELFPAAVWRRCVASAASAVPSSEYGDPRGDIRLREKIVAYLRRARGLTLTTDQIIITNGAVHAMHLLSALYLDSRSKVVVENPGYPLAHQTFQLSGASIIPCGVDNDGIQVHALPKNTKNIRMVYVTPSHQFPTGSRLSLGRRRALIDWADKHGVLVVEDDYDGEFRYDVPPLAPLAAMKNSCVVYCGTFSKTMFPGLRTGYAVAPQPLIDAMAKYRAMSEYCPNSITQSALVRFIEEGHYERHVHRMRRLYAAKRRALSDGLAAAGFPGEMEGLESGLNGLIRLDTGTKASSIAAKARKAGVFVPTIRRYAVDDTIKDDALVLWYSALTETQIKRGIKALF